MPLVRIEMIKNQQRASRILLYMTRTAFLFVEGDYDRCLRRYETTKIRDEIDRRSFGFKYYQSLEQDITALQGIMNTSAMRNTVYIAAHHPTEVDVFIVRQRSIIMVPAEVNAVGAVRRL